MRQRVFPAPAGINRVSCWNWGTIWCVPRASGDKPERLNDELTRERCSPRQRG
ncbi:hypothetical protein JKH02_003155 [Salmonella enterica]|nr:hypothetical protein [Salmonella enterica]EGC3712840.1 hypothetical protein [Salmonella enterica]EGM2273502.1 hypothetical protein [Salmonella enterica]EHA1985843.1 hypothetical protein [Salmonella enterica]